MRGRDGFFATRNNGSEAMWARIRGREYRLEVERRSGEGTFSDGVVTLHVRHPERRPLSASVREGAPDGHLLDFAAYLNMAMALDGVLDQSRLNPVNAGLVGSE